MLHGTLVAGSLPVTCLHLLCCVCLTFSTLNWCCEILQNLFLPQDLRATQKGTHNGNTKSEFICLVLKILPCFPVIILAHSLLIKMKTVDQQRLFLLSYFILLGIDFCFFYFLFLTQFKFYLFKHDFLDEINFRDHVPPAL